VPALAILSLLALGLYWPSLNGPFVFDDPNAVSQSNLVRHLNPISFVTLSTRPLTDYTYAINYAIGGLDTFSFHLTNVLLHAVNGVLVYAIAWLTLGLPVFAARYGAARRAIAFAAAALFVAHPLATETVAYVSSRSEVLAASFYLLSVLSFILAAVTDQPRRRRLYSVALPLFGFAGLASKESALTIVPALLIYDWLFLTASGWRRPRRRLFVLAAIPPAVGGLALLLKAIFSPSPMGEYKATAGLGFDRFTPAQYLMTQFGVIAYYLRLVVLPIGQTFDYDWPLAQSPFSVGVIAPFALLAGVVVLAWRAARREPLFTFAVAWTLLTLLPTSSVVPIADLAVERRMYLPLVALCLLGAAWAWDLAQWVAARLRGVPQPESADAPTTASPTAPSRAWPYWVVIGAALASLGALTVVRASLWGDAIALHEDGVAKAPGNPRVRLNLGVTYLNLQQQDRAYETLLEAKRLYDRHESMQAFPRIGAFIQYNLGAVLFARGQVDRAEVELKRSLELGGQYLALRPMAKMLLSRVDAQRGDWKAAIADLTEALKYQDNPDWRVDLAEMQRQSGDIATARTTLKWLLVSNPDNQRAIALLAKINATPAAP
jgi:tetratricopeptide (TPR) repeat protein